MTNPTQYLLRSFLPFLPYHIRNTSTMRTCPRRCVSWTWTWPSSLRRRRRRRCRCGTRPPRPSRRSRSLRTFSCGGRRRRPPWRAPRGCEERRPSSSSPPPPSWPPRGTMRREGPWEAWRPPVAPLLRPLPRVALVGGPSEARASRRSSPESRSTRPTARTGRSRAASVPGGRPIGGGRGLGAASRERYGGSPSRPTAGAVALAGVARIVSAVA
mmetsp:Transcript_43155/g.80122  ORF Transcript_43155/g.80122 Transcript_43155/m.80122 type:complete len:214 (-) Transcript_43155:1533-2174(-)